MQSFLKYTAKSEISCRNSCSFKSEKQFNYWNWSWTLTFVSQLCDLCNGIIMIWYGWKKKKLYRKSKQQMHISKSITLDKIELKWLSRQVESTEKQKQITQILRQKALKGGKKERKEKNKRNWWPKCQCRTVVRKSVWTYSFKLTNDIPHS